MELPGVGWSLSHCRGSHFRDHLSFPRRKPGQLRHDENSVFVRPTAFADLGIMKMGLLVYFYVY